MRSKSEINWLVVFTRYRAEKKLMETLNRNGFESYVPLYTSVRQWSDRKKKVALPLINSVVFVKYDINSYAKLFNYDLVSRVLTENGKPGLVTNKEIETLKLISTAWDSDNISKEACEKVTKGDLVEIRRGDFKGATGIISEKKGQYRFIIQLNSIDTQFVLNVPVSQIKRIDQGQN